MKNYVLFAVMSLGLLMTTNSVAQPTTETAPHETPQKQPNLELQVKPKTYLPIWNVGDELKHKMQKFIWVPSKDGHILVLEASSEAILRLAWNLDTYEHGPKTKTY